MFVNGATYVLAAERYLRADDSGGTTRPVPVRRDGSVRVLVTFFHAGGPMRDRTYAPPYYAVWLHPDGTVSEHGEHSGADLGISDPARPAVGVDVHVDGLGLVEGEKELYALCPEVFEAWRSGAKSERVESAARRYWEVFSTITTPRTSGWYEQMAPDFMTWLRART